MGEFELPPGATPHSVEVDKDGMTAILRGYITSDGTFLVIDIDTVGVDP